MMCRNWKGAARATAFMGITAMLSQVLAVLWAQTTPVTAVILFVVCLIVVFGVAACTGLKMPDSD